MYIFYFGFFLSQKRISLRISNISNNNNDDNGHFINMDMYFYFQSEKNFDANT